MVEKSITRLRNVVDISLYRKRDGDGRIAPRPARLCRHCGAALLEGEREEECSSAFNLEIRSAYSPPRRLVAD